MIHQQWIIDGIIAFNKFVIFYFLTLNSFYLLLVLLSLGAVHKFVRRTFFTDYRQILESEMTWPISVIVPAKDEADAIRLANQSVYGLGGAVFTADAARGERIAANELEAGCTFVNTFVRSDPRLPFGGIKQSGYGRELGIYGIKEFVNIKTVYVA